MYIRSHDTHPRLMQYDNILHTDHVLKFATQYLSHTPNNSGGEGLCPHSTIFTHLNHNAAYQHERERYNSRREKNP